MKKIFLILVVTLEIMFGIQNFVYAESVKIYDGNINDIISNLEIDCENFNTNIYNLEYYTYEGARRCELNFGNSKNNIVRFRLNSDDSVERVLISIPNSFVAKDGSSYSYNQAAFIQGSIEKSIGLSKSETSELGNKFREAFQNFGRNNSNAHHYHEKFSVWCSKTNRYIVRDVEMDDDKFDWYIYAYR